MSKADQGSPRRPMPMAALAPTRLGGWVCVVEFRRPSHARIVAPAPRRNICQLADAASQSWGILNQFGGARSRSVQEAHDSALAAGGATHPFQDDRTPLR